MTTEVWQVLNGENVVMHEAPTRKAIAEWLKTEYNATRVNFAELPDGLYHTTVHTSVTTLLLMLITGKQADITRHLATIAVEPAPEPTRDFLRLAREMENAYPAFVARLNSLAPAGFQISVPQHSADYRMMLVLHHAVELRGAVRLRGNAEAAIADMFSALRAYRVAPAAAMEPLWAALGSLAEIHDESPRAREAARAIREAITAITQEQS